MNGIPVRSVQFVLCLLVLASSAYGQTQGSDHPDTAVSTRPSDPPSANSSAGKAHDTTFIIGNDDMLSINVWKEADLSRTIPVRSDGKISLPLVGEVQAAGKTPSQLELDIASKLRSFMTDPEVSVMVQQINSEKVNVLGQVAKPGPYSLAVAGTVMDGISVAGGLRDFAKEEIDLRFAQKSIGWRNALRIQLQRFRQRQEHYTEHQARSARHNCCALKVDYAIDIFCWAHVHGDGSSLGSG